MRVPVGVPPSVITASPVSAAATASGRSLGVLDGHSLAADLTVVQLVHCVFRVSGIIEFHKSISVFEGDVPQFSISLEEFLNVTFPCSVGQAPNEYSCI